LPWIKREWFFAIELENVRAPDDIDTRIMKPLLAVMRSAPGAVQALIDADAITWPGVASTE
jgi:phenylpropionate dioxygenase-like ring-hydroxylating dioxygenase large terminal subunit